MEAIFDQIRDYLEVCESLMDDDWSPMDIIDNINLLVRDMNFDVVSMVLIDEETPNKFAMPVSRGYRMPPPPEVVACWSEAFEGRVELDWDKLVAVAGRRDSALAAWIVKEDLRSFAYIPIHDQESIHGFLFIGSRKSIKLTPMASNIMELCGGRIGLSLTARELFGKWPDFVSEAVKQLKDQLSVAMGSLEMAVESAVAAPEELRSLIAQCAAAVQGCVQIVDSLGAQADSPPG